MTYIHREVSPSGTEGIVLSEEGGPLSLPVGWSFLPAGDAAITRSVKAKGPTWIVRVRRGRRTISLGIWAKDEHILVSQKEVESKRSTPEYARKRQMDLARRAAKHRTYVEEFRSEVVRFLNFHSMYRSEAGLLAEKVTEHATPVGSGTVARTERLPLSRRAEAAVIAWMRHETTTYDSMIISRIKGKRREVRRQLAVQSVEVLKRYREGRTVDEDCPLKKALEG